MFVFKKDRKNHWEHVYTNSSPFEVGWYQKHPEMSLKSIAATGINFEGRIIDIGGGTSNLPAILLDQGYRKITVLDISAKAIEKAKSLLQEKSEKINRSSEYLLSETPRILILYSNPVFSRA